MDPKKLSGIDPKLQEAYNRIMATPTPANQPQSGQANPQSSAKPSAAAEQPATNHAASSGQPIPPQPLPTLTPIDSHSNNKTPSTKPNNNAHAAVGMVAKSGSGVPTVVLIVAAVIFFLVYTLFFIKLFGVSVPFLP